MTEERATIKNLQFTILSWFLENMHTEIFNDKQVELLPYIKGFKQSFYRVGGTAMALHIGHRQSIDFDLFTNKQLKKVSI